MFLQWFPISVIFVIKLGPSQFLSTYVPCDIKSDLAISS